VVVDLDRRDQPGRRALSHVDAAAPGQEDRVVFDLVDEGEHLFGAVIEQDGFVDDCHDAV